MNTIKRALLGLAAGVILSGVVAARAQEGFATKPTQEHELLKDDVGTWDATIKSWTPGGPSEPSVSSGVETNTLLPGGFWVLSRFEGKIGDMSFHGAGQTGYDTLKKKFVGTWVDSMSSSLLVTEGEYDAASKTLTSYTDGADPEGKPYKAKLVIVHKDKDHRVFTMSMKTGDPNAEYVKMMEISYTRREK